jgi:hypothetical protein
VSGRAAELFCGLHTPTAVAALRTAFTAQDATSDSDDESQQKKKKIYYH